VPSLDEMADALDMTRQEIARLQDRMFRSVVLALEHEVGDMADEELTLVDVLIDERQVEPLEELETRELHSYLRDAISLLPERHRFVVVGYFLENKTSQDLARFLGVTESRVSQLRSEALMMLKEGIEAQYSSHESIEPPSGRVARRKASYAVAISDASDWTDRIEHVQLIESETRVLPAMLQLS
jgi:RNA polymerase sigma factor for flagellar operon FliA